jgi:thiol-disulfide isomerase/thioredoxin
MRVFPVLLSLGVLARAGGVAAQPLEPFAGDPTPPPLVLPDLEGRQHRLADYRGQVVLVNFWTTWCPPCVKEIPALQRLKVRMRDRPFTILAVNVADSRALSLAYLARFSADFTVLLDEAGTTVKPWKVYVFPTSFLVDAEGRIRSAIVGALDWDAQETLAAIETLMPDTSRGRREEVLRVPKPKSPPVDTKGTRKDSTAEDAEQAL